MMLSQKMVNFSCLLQKQVLKYYTISGKANDTEKQWQSKLFLLKMYCKLRYDHFKKTN